MAPTAVPPVVVAVVVPDDVGHGWGCLAVTAVVHSHVLLININIAVIVVFREAAVPPTIIIITARAWGRG